MNRMTLTPELTEALCGFCCDVATMENNVDLIDSIEEHYIDDDAGEPARVLDTLKALRNMKRDMIGILKAMRKAENV